MIVCAILNKIYVGQAGHAISELCTGQATEIVWMGRYAEPFAAHWDGEMANKSWKRNMFRHVETQNYKERTSKNVVSVQTKTK